MTIITESQIFVSPSETTAFAADAWPLREDVFAPDPNTRGETTSTDTEYAQDERDGSEPYSGGEVDLEYPEETYVRESYPLEEAQPEYGDEMSPWASDSLVEGEPGSVDDTHELDGSEPYAGSRTDEETYGLPFAGQETMGNTPETVQAGELAGESGWGAEEFAEEWDPAGGVSQEWLPVEQISLDGASHGEDDPAEAPSPTGTVRAGRLVVNRLPLMRNHAGTHPDLVLKWNDMVQPTAVDIVVHLHGYSGRGAAMNIIKHKEPVSGLDFADPDNPTSVGRTTPTLLVLPRGNHQPHGRYGYNPERYTFPALVKPGALQQLIDDALARFADATGAIVHRNRLILTAHSGGGAPLMAILSHTCPDEVHTFDALYENPAHLITWAQRRMAAGTGALRVLYRPGEGTARHSLAVARALAAVRASGFRVEATKVAHNSIPRKYGWRLLADAAADLPGVTLSQESADEAVETEASEFDTNAEFDEAGFSDQEGDGEFWGFGEALTERDAETWSESEEASAADTPGLVTFTARTLPIRVSVLATTAARQASQVEVLVFAHGLDVCGPILQPRPQTFITERPFKLGALVEASGRPIILIVPFLDWENLGKNKMGFGHKWHKLAQPENLNGVVAEALEQVGTPTIQRLILAGHSRAFGVFDALARAHANPEMANGALGRLSHVWAFDSTYTSPVTDWMAWLRSRNDLRITVIYRYAKYFSKKTQKEESLSTGVHGSRIRAQVPKSGGRLTVIPVPASKVDHCAIPSKYLPGLLSSLPSAPSSISSEESYVDEMEEDFDLAADDLSAEAEAFDDEWLEEPLREEEEEEEETGIDELQIEGEDESETPVEAFGEELDEGFDEDEEESSRQCPESEASDFEVDEKAPPSRAPSRSPKSPSGRAPMSDAHRSKLIVAAYTQAMSAGTEADRRAIRDAQSQRHGCKEMVRRNGPRRHIPRAAHSRQRREGARRSSRALRSPTTRRAGLAERQPR